MKSLLAPPTSTRINRLQLITEMTVAQFISRLPPLQEHRQKQAARQKPWPHKRIIRIGGTVVNKQCFSARPRRLGQER